MAMYKCFKCGEFIDDDISPMEVVEHNLIEKYDGELVENAEVCPSCNDEINQEAFERHNELLTS